MAAIVTGARGFLGRHLVTALAAAGQRVAGIGHGDWPDAAICGLGAWYAGEVDADSLDGAATALGGVDVVYHLAGGSSVAPSLTAPYDDFRNTVDTTARLAEWLRLHSPAARLVVASSAAVYGVSPLALIDEAAPLRPASPYGAHKAMLEALLTNRAQCFGLPVAIVRLFSAYGPGLKKQLMWDVCHRCAAGERVMVAGSGDELRDWIHVDDAVALLRLAADAASAEAPVFNGGTGVGSTVRHAVTLLCDAWAQGRTPVFDGTMRAGDPPSLVAAMGRAHAAGFVAGVALADGIDDYVRWFRSR